MDEFSKESVVTQEVEQHTKKFQEYFEQSIGRSFECFIPLRYKSKVEGSKTTYDVSINLGNESTGKLLFSYDPECEHKYSILKAGIEGEDFKLDLV